MTSTEPLIDSEPSPASTMRALVFDRPPGDPGAAPELMHIDVPVPVPGPGQLRIRVAAFGLNQADLLLMSGRHYALADLPMRLAYEASGVVDAVGEGVSRFSPGDRVSSIPNIDGPYACAAEYALADESFVTLAPEGWNDAEAAGFWMQYLTAYYPMVELFPIETGDWVLITGASGGTGLGAIRVARDRGARVIATSRTSEKADFLREQGADAVVATDEQDVSDALLHLTGGHGVDLVSDGIGGPFVAEYVEALASSGIAYVHGGLSGSNDVSFPVLPLVRKRAALHGYSLINETRDPAALERGIEYTMLRISDGRFGPPVVDSVYPFAQASDAYARMASGSQRGKIVVSVTS